MEISNCFAAVRWDAHSVWCWKILYWQGACRCRGSSLTYAQHLIPEIKFGTDHVYPSVEKRAHCRQEAKSAVAAAVADLWSCTWHASHLGCLYDVRNRTHDNFNHSIVSIITRRPVLYLVITRRLRSCPSLSSIVATLENADAHAGNQRRENLLIERGSRWHWQFQFPFEIAIMTLVMTIDQSGRTNDPHQTATMIPDRVIYRQLFCCGRFL